MHITLGELGITQARLDGVHALAEQVHAQLLETSSGDGSVEVDTLIQSVNLQGGLGGGGQSTLRTLSCCTQAAKGAGVVGDILLVLALELLQVTLPVNPRTMQAQIGTQMTTLVDKANRCLKQCKRKLTIWSVPV